MARDRSNDDAERANAPTVDQARAAAPALDRKTVGKIAIVYSRSPTLGRCSLADIEWLILPAVQNGHFHVVEAADGHAEPRGPIAAATWAFVSPEIDARLVVRLLAARRPAPRRVGVGRHRLDRRLGRRSVGRRFGARLAEGGAVQEPQRQDRSPRSFRPRARRDARRDRRRVGLERFVIGWNRGDSRIRRGCDSTCWLGGGQREMPKPYSQDLRNRVIDAVERGEMSRRAAARRYEVSESAAVKWLGALRAGWLPGAGRAWRPSARQAHAAPGLSGSRADRETRHHASGAVRSSVGGARGQGRHFDDEPLLSPDRRHI